MADVPEAVATTLRQAGQNSRQTSQSGAEQISDAAGAATDVVAEVNRAGISGGSNS
jgi:hypothetical protein